MKKRRMTRGAAALFPVFFSVFFFMFLSARFPEAFPAACACAPAEERVLAPAELPLFVNGEEAEGEEGIFTDLSGAFYADIAALCRWIAPDFAHRDGDGNWMIRCRALDEGAVVFSGSRAYLDLRAADFCMRVDPYWLAEGVFSLEVRFSPALEADGAMYERTGETMPVPSGPRDGVSPEGRAMWRIAGDWWLENEDGLAWRYAPAQDAPDGDMAE